ncbi:MAG TPA: hypothetical protein DDW54_01365 [Clostridiales bacterium]|nr:hypothetical protein [Clostridiales bacterium]
MKKDNVIRLKRVIESDRLSVTQDCIELIIKDVSSVLNDYFTLSEKPEIKIIPCGDEYLITVSAKANALAVPHVIDNAVNRVF